jgi:glycosyltransferase involved in cell wall biosynthesis
MKLSIITVNYNDRKGLERTIRSVLQQTFKNYEFIIIDGGSADGSKELIEKWETEGIDYWVSEKDKGIYHAMNKGIAVSKGEYCFFLNSGDYLINELVLDKVFAQPLKEDIVSGNVLKLRRNGLFRVVKAHANPTLLKLCIHSLPHQATFINRTLFSDVGLFNETFRIASDFEFFLKAVVIKHKTYHYLDIGISYFNLEGISSNSQNSELAKTESRDCLYRLFPEMAEDLMAYRYFYISNVGQVVRILQQNNNVFRVVDSFFGGIFKTKKFLFGK